MIIKKYFKQIDNAVSEVLNSLDIKVYRSYYFQRWCTDFDNFVTHVEFLSYHRLIKLKCSAFFFYGAEGVNEQAFNGISFDFILPSFYDNFKHILNI